jgi:hypothetical protein
LWIRSCTRDEDFSPLRLLANRGGGEPAARAVRKISLAPADAGSEAAPSSIGAGASHAVTEGLAEMQRESVLAWSRMTDGEHHAIASEPASTERLKSLGYAQ